MLGGWGGFNMGGGIKEYESCRLGIDGDCAVVPPSLGQCGEPAGKQRPSQIAQRVPVQRRTQRSAR